MRRSYFWVLHLLMITLGAYLAADVVNLIVGSYLEASIADPSEVRSSPRSRALPIAIQGRDPEYGSIVDGNIFNSNLRFNKPDPVRPVTLPKKIKPISRTPLNFTLVGTVVGRANTFAIIEDDKTKEQSLYRVGHILEVDAKIAKIERNRVVLLRGADEEILEVSYIPKEKGARGRHLRLSATPPVSTAPAPPREGGVRQVSKDQWVLDRQEIDGAINNLPQLLTKARIIPNFNNGKPDGFRIFAISKGSLYAKIGLKNGDILHRVNGIEVKDPKNFLQVFEQLKDESQITVDLVRRNTKETFNYEIR